MENEIELYLKKKINREDLNFSRLQTHFGTIFSENIIFQFFFIST